MSQECYIISMGTPSLQASSGLATFSKALAQALGLPYLRAIGLAMDGAGISTSKEDFFDGYAFVVTAGEMLLSSLGYRMLAVRLGSLPELDELGIEPQRYAATITPLPRAIPLTPVSPDLVRKAFTERARQRAPSYDDPSQISLQQLADTIAGMVMRPPQHFGSRIVKHLADAFPIVVGAQTGLLKSHIALVCGCSLASLPTVYEGVPHHGMERHLAFYRHLGIGLTIAGPGGEIAIRPDIHPLAKSLRQIDIFARKQQRPPQASRGRSQAKAGSSKRASTAAAAPEDAATGSLAETGKLPHTARGTLSVEEIIAKLKAGSPPLDLARLAGVSHQYIYKIARDAGISRRRSSVILAQDALRNLFPKP
jgi:hypothetical protein